jgi:hypothetical protein
MLVALVIHHANLMFSASYNIVICALCWLYNKFPLYFINCTIVGNNLLNVKTCVLIFSTNFV